MIWKKLLSIFLIIVGFQSASATINLGDYKKFRNESLESQFKSIQAKLAKFDTVDVKIKNHYFYQESLHASNDYYTNLAYANFVDYFTYQGDLKSLTLLYQENITHPKTKHLLSYIQLLSKYYIVFYNYGLDDECRYILGQLKNLKNHLPEKERLYAQAIINIYDGMIEKDINTFDLNKSLLLEAIDIIEHLKNNLQPNEYKIRLSSAYNHLAISYANNVQLNLNNKVDYNINEVEHAASLLRKAIRINSDFSYWHSTIYKSNLAYINNILKNSEDAIYYGNRSIFYASKIKNSQIFLRRSACNVADTYMVNNMTNNSAYKEAYSICIESRTKFEKDKAYFKNLLNSFNRPQNIHYEKKSFISDNLIYLLIGGVTVILIILLGLKFTKKTKHPKYSSYL